MNDIYGWKWGWKMMTMDENFINIYNKFCFVKKWTKETRNLCWFIVNCRNLNLGLVTKAKVCKVAGQEESQESYNIFLGVWKGVREWTLTPPRGSTLGSWSFDGLLNLQKTI
jgi:hypothetical protein